MDTPTPSQPDKINLIQMSLADGYHLPEMEPTIMKLCIEPDARLRMRCDEVDPSEIKDNEDLISMMIYTMYCAGGVGLAAPQVGINKRLFVFDTDWPTRRQLRPNVLINPIIQDRYDEVVCHEGCLSVGANFFADIRRAGGVEVEGLDIRGEKVEYTFTGFDAAVMQHEIDHLDGKLFIDYVGRIQLDMLKAKRRKLKKTAARIALFAAASKKASLGAGSEESLAPFTEEPTTKRLNPSEVPFLLDSLEPLGSGNRNVSSTEVHGV